MDKRIIRVGDTVDFYDRLHGESRQMRVAKIIRFHDVGGCESNVYPSTEAAVPGGWYLIFDDPMETGIHADRCRVVQPDQDM